MADSSKNFERAYYPNIYHVIDSLQQELDGKEIETSLILNKVDKVNPYKKRQSKIDIVSANLMQEYSFFSRIIPISIRSQININLLQVRISLN